jgi:hypothetical protein
MLPLTDATMEVLDILSEHHDHHQIKTLARMGMELLRHSPQVAAPLMGRFAELSATIPDNRADFSACRDSIAALARIADGAGDVLPWCSAASGVLLTQMRTAAAITISEPDGWPCNLDELADVLHDLDMATRADIISLMRDGGTNWRTLGDMPDFRRKSGRPSGDHIVSSCDDFMLIDADMLPEDERTTAERFVIVRRGNA